MRILLLAALPLVALPAVVAAQSAPPVKMGLWRMDVTTTMAGMGDPQTTSSRTCLTPEKWQKAFEATDSKCKLTNQHQSSAGMSTDMACGVDADNQSTGHVEMTFDSAQKVHGKMHMEAHSASRAKPILIDSTFAGTYLGADCQGIPPDQPRDDK